MSDKTEAATPKRLRRARMDGDMPKSVHITVTASGFIWWLFLLIEAPHVGELCIRLIEQVTQIDATHDFASRCAELWDAVAAFGPVVFATLGAGALAVVVPELAQTRGLLAWKRAAPDIKRLNPIATLKNLFGIRLLFDTALMLVQFVILLIVCWHALVSWFVQLLPSYALTLPGEFERLSLSHARLLAMVAASQLVPAVADFAIQRFQWLRRLRMDKNEIKREYRDDEGDPHVKGRRRALHRELSR